LTKNLCSKMLSSQSGRWFLIVIRSWFVVDWNVLDNWEQLFRKRSRWVIEFRQCLLGWGRYWIVLMLIPQCRKVYIWRWTKSPPALYPALRYTKHQQTNICCLCFFYAIISGKVPSCVQLLSPEFCFSFQKEFFVIEI